MNQQKDKKLQQLDSNIAQLESDLKEAEKEYEDIAGDDGANKIEAAKLAYEKAQTDHKAKLDLWNESVDELKKLAEHSTERKHGSTSYGTRLGEITILGNTLVVDRWALRSVVLQTYVYLMSLDAPDVAKINAWATAETAHGRPITLLGNTNNGPAYDQVDVDAGVINPANNQPVKSTDIGKAGPTAPSLDKFTAPLTNTVHNYSAEGLLRQWKRFKYHAEKLVAVRKIEKIIPDDGKDTLDYKATTKFVFAIDPTAAIRDRANTQSNLIESLTNKNSSEYIEALIPQLAMKPRTGVTWESKELYKVFDYPEFVNFFEFMFPNNTLSSNSLLQSGTPGALGPDSLLKDPEYKNFNIYPVFKGQTTTKTNKVAFKDGSISGTKNNVPDSINTLVKSGTTYYHNECYAHKFSDIISVGKGLQWVFANYHNVFGNVANKTWFLESTSDKVGTGSTSKIVFSGKYSGPITYLRNGDEISLPAEPDASEVTRKRIEYEKAQSEHAPADSNLVISKIRLLVNEITKLKKERRELTGTTEQGLFSSLRSIVTNLNKDATKRPKKELSYYDDFEERLGQLTEVVLERVAKHNNWADDSDSKKNWKLWTAKSTEFPNDEKTFTAEILGEIKKAYNTAFDTNGHATKARPLYGKLNSIFYSKRPKDKTFDQFLKDFLDNKGNSKKAEEILEILSQLENHVALTIDDKELRDKLKTSEVLIKSLSGMLEKILGKGYDRKILTRWEKTDFAKEPKFFELITEPNDISKGAKDKFKDFLAEENSKWSNKYLADFLKEQEDISLVVQTIMRFRIKEYLKKTATEREEIGAEKALDWFTILKKNFGYAGDLTTSDGKSADEIEIALLKKAGKAVSDYLGLDMKIETEANLVLEWNAFKDGKKYAEKISLVKTDEEFLKKEGGDWKAFIKSGKPEDIISKVCLYKIEKTGITLENVESIKKEDKEKVHNLEELEKWLEDLENIGKATEEHKKLRAAVAAHKVKLESEKPKEMAPKETPTPETPKETPKDSSEDKDKDKDKTQEGDRVPWYKKAYGAWIWGSILVLVGIGVLGYFMGWWGGKKEEGEGTEGEEETEVAE